MAPDRVPIAVNYVLRVVIKGLTPTEFAGNCVLIFVGSGKADF